MFMDQSAVTLLSHHYDVLIGDYPTEAIVRHLNQGPSGTENIKELFRLSFSAHGPKTTANAASHDDSVSIRVFQVKVLLMAMKLARKRRTIVDNRIFEYVVVVDSCKGINTSKA